MRPEKHSAERSTDFFSENIYRLLLPRHLQLIPGLNEVYELELAFYESRILNDEDIIRRCFFDGQLCTSQGFWISQYCFGVYDDVD